MTQSPVRSFIVISGPAAIVIVVAVDVALLDDGWRCVQQGVREITDSYLATGGLSVGYPTLRCSDSECSDKVRVEP
jgi:hypothetical protein